MARSNPAILSLIYARADGRGMAGRLFEALAANQISGWMDERSIESHQEFSVDIEKAIEDATHVVVCSTPSIQGSDSFVRREIFYAQQKGSQLFRSCRPSSPRTMSRYLSII